MSVSMSAILAAILSGLVGAAIGIFIVNLCFRVWERRRSAPCSVGEGFARAILFLCWMTLGAVGGGAAFAFGGAYLLRLLLRG